MSAPTLARAVGSPVVHYLNRGAATWRTMCGRDATLMARWNPADVRVDSRTWRQCERCGA